MTYQATAVKNLPFPSTAAKAESPRSSRKKRRGSFPKQRKEMIRACEKMLGDKIVAIDYPGGKSRDAVALTLKNGGVVIATVRGNSYRADLEHRVLVSLASHNAPVPQVLGFNGKTLLLQEKLEGQRLSQAFHGATPATVEVLLSSALDGLTKCQNAGSDVGLDHLPTLGSDEEWINKLVHRPLVIGGYLEEKPPRPNVDDLLKLFAVKEPRFVKWDARPGNAMVSDDGHIAWFDWEHCGSRCRLDDIVWLLCDEFTPDRPDMEARLIERYLNNFADAKPLDEAHRYLKAYGVFHSVVRLGLILSLKKNENWWDFDYCVERDKVGVTLDCAHRVTRRAARWAGFDATTRPLVSWFENIAYKLETL